MAKINKLTGTKGITYRTTAEKEIESLKMAIKILAADVQANQPIAVKV